MNTAFEDEQEPSVTEAVTSPQALEKPTRPGHAPEHWHRTVVAAGITNRAESNLIYFLYQAAEALGWGSDPKFHWLMPSEEDSDWKYPLLRELGRLEDEDEIRELATELCSTKPKIKDGKAIIKRHRGVLPRPQKPLDEAISCLISTYLKREPKLPYEAIEAALRVNRENLRWMLDGTAGNLTDA
jgi:hypothetical protein